LPAPDAQVPDCVPFEPGFVVAPQDTDAVPPRFVKVAPVPVVVVKTVTVLVLGDVVMPEQRPRAVLILPAKVVVLPVLTKELQEAVPSVPVCVPVPPVQLKFVALVPVGAIEVALPGASAVRVTEVPEPGLPAVTPIVE
jgi:hypothetical protein